MIEQYYNDYAELGLFPIGVNWDAEKKSTYHPVGWETAKELFPLHNTHNGLMVRIDDDYGCLDFDLKNTQNKDIFNQWKAIVINTMPDVYNKLYIEETRNKGYHVWFKYTGLTHKTGIAKSEEGAEVIAVYCKRKLIYTYPTPGYSLYHQSMEDVGYLTSKEYQYLVETSQLFNEYKPKYDPNKKAVNYPIEHQDILMKFDKVLSDENFTQILNEIGLEQVHDFRYKQKDSFVAFRRKGSEALYSAKVYYKSKRMMLFTASMPEYPSWHDKEEYEIWSLPPSFILFYKNDRDWDTTVEVCKMILDAQGEELPIVQNEIKFPLDVFPNVIAKSILEVSEARSLAPQFVATAGLWTISSLAGDRYFSDFNGDGKNILFCLMIAPVSVGKTPAYKVMCETPLKRIQEEGDKKFNEELKEWTLKKSKSQKDKQSFDEPRPKRYIPIIVDGTTEGYINKSMHQKNGMGVYQDEAETILNAGGYKKSNDSISFFTQAFSGGRITQIRADETLERVVPNLNLNLLMGTQPSRLKNIFTDDRLESGFASRFLMVDSDYILLNIDEDPFSQKKEMCSEWIQIVEDLYSIGYQYNNDVLVKQRIRITEEGKNAFRTYNKMIKEEANNRIKNKAEGFIMGTEAKMSAYLPRLCQVLAIMYDIVNPVIDEKTVHNAYRLYRYYAENTIRIIGGLINEINTGLNKESQKLYDLLPDEFTSKQAKEICKMNNLPERKFEITMKKKDFASMFKQEGRGKFSKIVP